jgi:hypothetical protein
MPAGCRLVADGYERASNESPSISAVEACDRGALGVAELTHVDERGAVDEHRDAEDELPRARRKRAGEALGFHLHTGVAVAAHHRLGREILLRYCARPLLSLERLSVLDDGRIAYRIKKPWRPDRTHRVMTPLEFMARLVALIPPPRTPLIHFHGAFAPNFRRRALVVPVGGAPPDSKNARSPPPSVANCEHGGTSRASPANTIRVGNAPASESQCTEPAEFNLAPPPSLPPIELTPFKSAPWRIDWATLLLRVHDVDALACPCGGRLRFIELATDRARAREILDRLGLPLDAPEPRPVRASRDLDDLPPPDW